jgi:hypothetical protein
MNNNSKRNALIAEAIAAAAATEENSTPMNDEDKRHLSTAINMLSSYEIAG